MSDRSESVLDRMMRGLILLGIFGLIDLILFGVFGWAGQFVKSFIIGIFGYAAYGYSIAMTVVGLFITLGFKPKVTFKVVVNYIAIAFVIICIGQIATITNEASLGYVGAMKYAFDGHDTLGGAAFFAFLYPFFLARTVGVVIFTLFLVGLIVLAIINQLNFDIGLKLRNTKKPSTVTYYQNDDNQTSDGTQAYQQDPNYMEPQLYNGDVNGRLFDDNSSKQSFFARYRKAEDVDMTPIDEVKQSYMSEEEQDNIISSIDAIPKMDEGEAKLTEQRMQEFAQASPIIPVEEPKKEETPKIQITDRDRLYFTSKRRELLRGEDIKRDEEVQEPEYTAYNQEIVPDVPSYTQTSFDDSIYQKPQEPENKVDPFESIMQNIMQEDEPQKQEEVIEDKTEYNYHFDDIDNAIKKNEEEQEEKRKAEEKKQFENFATNYTIKEEKKVEPKIEPKVEPVKPSIPVAPEKKVEPEKPKRVYKKYKAPSIDMLEDFNDPIEDDSVLQQKAEELKATLANFRVNVEIVGTIKGPTFSRINFRLEPGTPVKNLTSKADDIKMGLAVTSMRLLAPVPGTNYCGVEIPNKTRSKVNLKTVYKSAEYQKAISKQSGLVFALGQDINGTNFSYDLTQAPHMLVCGQTRSGKSVALNVMLISLLCRYSPEELRLILFDPKQVEFEPFSGIPHLLIPQILSEPQKAISAMNWAVNEMERRYELLKSTGVRNLEEYNSRPEIKADPLKRVPYIVIVIDEFAEVVSQGPELKKQFNVVIQRLAAKARAAGIHLVLATQRPSVDIVTGTIKSNLPTRMALKTTDAVNSATILGQGGAEELLGWGDMLLMTPDSSELKRIQGAFISTNGVIDIIDYVKNNNDKYFDEEAEKMIMAEPKQETPEQLSLDIDGAKPNGGIDPQFIDALEICVKFGRVSTSFLQMKLSIGFPRAAKIVDWMIESGYVQVEGNKKVCTATQQDVEKLRSGGEEE